MCDFLSDDDFPMGCINYEFACADCGEGRKERFKRIDLGVRGVLIAAMVQMDAKRQKELGSPPRRDDDVIFFDFRQEIVPCVTF